LTEVDQKTFHVILSGSEGWIPLVLDENYDKGRLTESHIFSEFTKDEALAFFKCLRNDKDDNIFLEKVYKDLKGHISSYLKLNALLVYYEYNEAIGMMIEDTGIDFLKAKINFNLIEAKSSKLELTNEALSDFLTLMYKLIKKQGRLEIDDETKKLMNKEINQINVFQIYREDAEKFIDFQTNLHRLYAEQLLGYRGNTVINWRFRLFLEEEYHILILDY